jgi:hypothetical protein
MRGLRACFHKTLKRFGFAISLPGWGGLICGKVPADHAIAARLNPVRTAN